jgi:16S rRNA (guanine966-N2)-methyltransferase
VRVIGGEKRGFPLAALSGRELRPTSSRVREALFDILAGRVRDARFLDLFAGSGAVGIEALSRGADHCLFVEDDRRAARLIRRNLEVCGLQARAEIRVARLPEDFSWASDGEPFDIVFADPPYHHTEGDLLLASPRVAGLLKPESLFVLEHRKSWRPAPRTGSVLCQRSIRYGDSVLSFFVPATAKPPSGAPGSV